MFSSLVERLMQEAMRAGEFDGLRGAGRPVDLTAYFETPPELRAAYGILRSAGVLPREVDLLREIAELEAPSKPRPEGETERDRGRRAERLRLELNVLLERNKPRTGHK